MPRMNGWEFLQHKTADPTIAGIPKIVLSDVPVGAMNSLAKPVDIERLLAVIAQYVSCVPKPHCSPIETHVLTMQRANRTVDDDETAV
jgi:CheY-like chemotaxis protein